MGGNSCSEGHGFELQHRKLDGHLFEKAKLNDQEAGNGPFFK